MPEQPDNLKNTIYALEGKIATMDNAFKVLDRGVVYINAGKIVDVRPMAEPPPVGFAAAPLIRTGGTIYPGLIELHNHLSYNILPMWDVPKRFTNRAQWGSHADYRKLVSGPMKVLGQTPHYSEAIVRYVECKCLLGGVTTSQGIRLYSDPSIHRYYRGITRNVEEPDDPNLPKAYTRISDVEAEDASKFLQRLKDEECFLLHLSEGVDENAHRHFEALHLPNGQWAIADSLSGIHCAGLRPEDFQIMQQHGASMVWSPLSNLLLYGETADIKAAKDSGMLIGIGSDWSLSGSKNLLGELKVAYLVSEELGGVFEKKEILAMATINAARILKWDKFLGSIEPDKHADLMVVDDRSGDPYDRLFNSRESSIKLVVINGVPRYGQTRLMKRLVETTEELAVGRASRALNLKQEAVDPAVGKLTLSDARNKLKNGLQQLAGMALILENTDHALVGGNLGIEFLEPDHAGLKGETERPHLPYGATGELTGMLDTILDTMLAGVPLSQLLEPIGLDELTVVDDEQFLYRLAGQPNLPDYIKAELPPLYGAEPVLPDSAAFLKNAPPATKPQFAVTTELSTVLRTDGHLSLADRREIVEQALVLMEDVYVHLPLKRAMHAADPVQRLKLLRYRMTRQSDDTMPPEIEFHKEMTSIFTSVRDLHTNYLLPSPYREKTAFLPFLIEEYYEDGEPKYIVSKVAGNVGPETFKKGVEVLYWNGIPIRRAIELNGDRQAGSNPSARHARGLDSLTVRPMIRVLPPDEEWVTLRYRTQVGEEHELEQKWLVFSPELGSGGVDPDAGIAEAAVIGCDLQTDVIGQVKKILYAPHVVAAEQRMAKISPEEASQLEDTETIMPGVFRREVVCSGDFGYIRIFTFSVKDADAFVAEFVRLAQSLPQNGLIIDVRGNGGGLIYAAERLLQVLTSREVEPERAQFINTPLTLRICRQHAPSRLLQGFDLGKWIKSIDQSVETGAIYSRSFPITTRESCNSIGQKYHGPVVLITDALCYSATDMFVAGFQDHDIGQILGTSGNTGAGGANVWTHQLLQILMSEQVDNPVDPYIPLPDSPFKPLPRGSGMRVSARRTLRVADQSGTPLEDLGVIPDCIHQMTKADLLSGNIDLINEACRILSGIPKSPYYIPKGFRDTR